MNHKGKAKSKVAPIRNHKKTREGVTNQRQKRPALRPSIENPGQEASDREIFNGDGQRKLNSLFFSQDIELSERPNTSTLSLASVNSSPSPIVAVRRQAMSIPKVEVILQEANDTPDRKVSASYTLLENEDQEDEDSLSEKADTDDQDQERSAKINAKEESSKQTNRALLNYFAKLSSSPNVSDPVNFEFLQSLLDKGASINTTDKYGQTILHEVARSWGTETARFLLDKGANINSVDAYGRCPLHVACINDYPEMVQFLLDNGADVHAKTTTEKQTGLHFSARSEASSCAKILLAYAADIEQRDYKGRTPLLLAAEYNSAAMARFLLEEGASPGVQDGSGQSALSFLFNKMPNVALKALDYFHFIDRPRRKQFFYINFFDNTSLHNGKKTHAQTPLEALVEGQYYELIMHPVLQKMIDVKWKHFGRKQAWLDIIPNVFLTVLYTTLAVLYPNDISTYYSNITTTWWRPVLEICVIFLTGNEIRKEVLEIYTSRRASNAWKFWRNKELLRDLEFCHPKYPQETNHVEHEIKKTRHVKKPYFQDKWNYFDWIAYVMVLFIFCMHYTNILVKSKVFNNAFISVMACTVILVWIRMLKYARPFPTQGPFVVMLDPIAVDTIKWFFLFMMFYIPYSAAFWMMFGGRSEKPVKGYESFFSLVYSTSQISLLLDFGFPDLAKQSPIMSRILCGSYLAISAVLLMNLYIAMLSNTFQKVFDNAQAVGAMERAALMQNLESRAFKRDLSKYRYILRSECSPVECDYQKITTGEEDREQRQDEKLSKMFSIVNERLGAKKVGATKKSDFDNIVDNLDYFRRAQAEIQFSFGRLSIKEKEQNQFNSMVIQNLFDLKSLQESNMLLLNGINERLSSLETVIKSLDVLTVERGERKKRHKDRKDHEEVATEDTTGLTADNLVMTAWKVPSDEEDL